MRTIWKPAERKHCLVFTSTSRACMHTRAQAASPNRQVDHEANRAGSGCAVQVAAGATGTSQELLSVFPFSQMQTRI